MQNSEKGLHTMKVLSFWSMAGLQVLVVALALALLTISPQAVSALGKLGLGAWFWGLLAALVSYLLLVYSNRLSATVQRDTRLILSRTRALFARLALWQLLVISALAGIGEELLFRAFLQSFIQGYSNMWLAVCLASVVFALLHFLSWVYFVFALLMGLALGFGYYLSGSLTFVMLWHGAYDLIALCVLVYAPHWLGLPRRQKTLTELAE